MKILLVQTAFLGDIILSAPLISRIKEIYPDCELWLLTTVAGSEIFKYDPRLKGIITFDKRGRYSGIFGLLAFAEKLRSGNFNVAYSLHKSFRTALLLFLAGIKKRVGYSTASLAFLYNQKVEVPKNTHQVEKNLALLPGNTAEFKLYVAAEYQNENLRNRTKPYAVIAPGSVWATKRWNWEGFRDAAIHLLARGYEVYLIGSEQEQELAEKVKNGGAAINLAGKLDLADSIKLISEAGLILVNDSMALHLASAFKIPTVAVFCATIPAFGFGPWDNSRAQIVEEPDLPCRPCGRHGGNSCPTGTQACMQIPVERVIKAIEKVLS